MADAPVKLAEGGDGAAIAAAPKGTVEAGELGSIVWIGGGEIVILPYLGAEHGEAFGIGVASTDADARINIAS